MDGKNCSCNCSCSSNDITSAIDQPRTMAGTEGPWFRSSFHIPGMDCPSEEQVIRLRLSDLPMKFMTFDLQGRTLVISHTCEVGTLIERLTPLGYGAELLESRPMLESDAIPAADDAAESRVLWILLGLNALMFVIETIAGLWARSAGLLSDAVDMFADAAVYGVALYAVGRDARHKITAARASGLLQFVVALAVLFETGRKFLTGSFPEELTMISISLIALAVNVGCLMLISEHRNKGVHMRASYIFSANDVLANLGVILAGVLVAWTGSAVPDWVIGFAIGMMVLVGSVRILRLR